MEAKTIFEILGAEESLSIGADYGGSDVGFIIEGWKKGGKMGDCEEIQHRMIEVLPEGTKIFSEDGEFVEIRYDEHKRPCLYYDGEIQFDGHLDTTTLVHLIRGEIYGPVTYEIPAEAEEAVEVMAREDGMEIYRKENRFTNRPWARYIRSMDGELTRTLGWYTDQQVGKAMVTT